MIFKTRVLVKFLVLLYGISTCKAADEKDDVWMPKGMFDDLIKIIGSYLNITLNQGIANIGNPLIDLSHLNIPDVIGTFDASPVYIDGLQKMYFTQLPNAGSSTNETGEYYNISLGKVCMDLLGVSFKNYVMDIALKEVLPLYGSGNLSLDINNVTLEINTALAKLNIENKNTGKKYTWMMNNLDVLISFRHSGINITGFFNNRQLNNYLTEILTLLESVVAMFFNYNSETISCVIGDIGKYFINQKLFNVTQVVKSNCLLNVPATVTDALARAKSTENLVEFFRLLEEKHVQHLINVLNNELDSRY